MTEACPTESLVHAVFQSVALAQIFLSAMTYHPVLDQQRSVIVQFQRSEAFADASINDGLVTCVLRIIIPFCSED
jgi:hypothetical protein